MSRKEMLAYLLTAIFGGTLAGHIGGLTGLLGLFVGLALVGFVDMLLCAATRHDELRPPMSPQSRE